MILNPTEIRRFHYKPEKFQNPWTGFMSFQHFRGEKLYSDIVVRPEANMTETERVECYPVSHDAEENGRSEGYYPDTSVAYIRVLWKEFEPQRGVYNYEFIENILRKAKEHGQTLIFRLMAHSTRACDDVPEWLKTMIPCPERPDGMRVKDSPTAPEFLEFFLEAIRKLGERFDEDPTFDAIDISLPGAWGEGYKLDQYPDDTFKVIVDTYLSVFRHTQLMSQAARPELIRYAEKTVPVGWRGDGLGEPHHTFEVYPSKIEKIEEVWKHAPVSFESYWWIGEWMRRGWDIDRIIECTLGWHLSSFNAKSMPIPEEWRDKIDGWVRRMGYHFAIDSVAFPALAAPGDTANFTLSLDNVGVAPIYKHLPLKFRLHSDAYTYTADTGADITAFLPGKAEVPFSCTLPADIPTGSYSLDVSIGEESDPMICFCTDAPRTGRWYSVGTVQIRG